MCVFSCCQFHPSVLFFLFCSLVLLTLPSIHKTVLLAFLIPKFFYFFSFHFAHPSTSIQPTPTKNRSAPLYIFKTTVVRTSKSYRPTNKFNTRKSWYTIPPPPLPCHSPLTTSIIPYIYVNHHHPTLYFCMNEIKY